MELNSFTGCAVRMEPQVASMYFYCIRLDYREDTGMI